MMTFISFLSSSLYVYFRSHCRVHNVIKTIFAHFLHLIDPWSSNIILQSPMELKHLLLRNLKTEKRETWRLSAFDGVGRCRIRSASGGIRFTIERRKRIRTFDYPAKCEKGDAGKDSCAPGVRVPSAILTDGEFPLISQSRRVRIAGVRRVTVVAVWILVPT